MITQENKFCLIMGEFNVDLLKHESHSASDTFINTLGSYFFQPHILQPTRITDHCATLIDNIFFNSLEHFLILNKFSVLPSSIKLHKRDYSNFNQSHLINDIQEIDWKEVIEPCNDPSYMFKSFHNLITNVIDKHIPVKELGRNEIKLKSKPWITSALRKSLQKKKE